MARFDSTRLPRPLPLPFAALAMLAAVPATASTPPAGSVLPPPASSPAPSSVQGPPDGMIAPSSRPAPTVPPAITVPQPQPPRATPTPTPAPTPAPTATAQPRRDGATTAARPEPRPAPAPATAAPAPQAPAGDASPAPQPPVQPANDAGATDSAAPSPATAAPATSNAPEGNGTPDWLPLAALAGLAALLAGGWLWWRARRERAAALAHTDDAPVPPRTEAAPRSDIPPAAPKPAAPKAAGVEPARAAPAAPAALGRRADLQLGFEPLSAQSTLINLRLGYAVTVRNTGMIAAEPLTLRIGLFAGSQANPQGIAHWFETNDTPPHHQLPSLAPGAEHRFEGELAAPLDALAPLTIDGRVLVVPLIALDARYGHGAGEAPIEGQAAHAFVIGREPGAASAKLAPFRLDQGPTVFAPLGQRDTGIGKVA